MCQKLGLDDAFAFMAHRKRIERYARFQTPGPSRDETWKGIMKPLVRHHRATPYPSRKPASSSPENISIKIVSPSSSSSSSLSSYNTCNEQLGTPQEPIDVDNFCEGCNSFKHTTERCPRDYWWKHGKYVPVPLKEYRRDRVLEAVNKGKSRAI